MLGLLFRLGPDRYFLDVSEVVEVLPLVDLTDLATGIDCVCGAADYRGEALPVVDLHQIARSEPSPEHYSTRIVVVNYPHQNQRYRLGLMAPHLVGTLRVPEEEFGPLGIRTADFIGAVATSEEGILQRIELQGLLPPPVRQRLFD